MTSSQCMLIIKLSSLGDLFHALPAATMIRQALGYEMDWVTQPEYAELVSHFEGVRRVIAFPRRCFLSRGAAFIGELRREMYDLVLDFQGLLKSALVARAARGRMRIGPSYAREGAGFFYDEIAGTLNKNRHAVDEALDFVRSLGLPRREVCFPVRLPRRSLEGARPHIGLLPCSRWVTKNWPVEKFAATAAMIRDHKPATFYILGSRKDRPAADHLAAQIGPDAVNLCGQTSLVELGGFLQDMDVLITVDSGPMHMAAALGVPVVAVFGATDPRRTGPYGPKHRVLVSEGLSCRPCFSESCARGDLACLRDIPPEKAAEATLEVLGRNSD